MAWYPIAHFLLAFFVGLLAYWLTSTILLAISQAGTLHITGGFIYRFSLVVALSLAIVSHILEDYLLGWF